MDENMLKGQVAVISGGLGDIGRAVGKKLASLGADIAIGDILDASRASEYLEELKAFGGRAKYDRIDISDAEAVEERIRNVEGALGIPSLVICNAAIVSIGNALTLDSKDWSRTLRVNLDGAFFLARTVAAQLVDRQMRGRIVFIGSWAAHAPHPQIAAYCVAKAGLRMLCKCMALELAPHRIMVNEIAPGYVDGGVSRRAWEHQPAMRAAAKTKVPVQALITNEEVAAQIVQLCHPDNRHITGSVLLMDGGLSLVAP